MWPGLVIWGHIDLEMCQIFFTRQCLTPGSTGLRERGGVGTTRVHHPPDNNLPRPLLHQALCWFIMGHQDEAWMSPREPSTGGFPQVCVNMEPQRQSSLGMLWARFASAEPLNGTKRLFPVICHSDSVVKPQLVVQLTKQSSLGLAR